MCCMSLLFTRISTAGYKGYAKPILSYKTVLSEKQ